MREGSTSFLVVAFTVLSLLIPFLSTSALTPVANEPARHMASSAAPTTPPTVAPSAESVARQGGHGSSAAHAVDVEDVSPAEAKCRKDFDDAMQEIVRSQPSGNSRSAEVKPANLGAYEYLVATLPDPSVSGLRYDFDRALDALLQAVEASGHTRDRFYMPWVSAPSCAEYVPAAFFFRPSPSGACFDNDTGLIVLVAGETPTWGVRKASFREALVHASHQRHGDTFFLLGPYFSGSASSLWDVLDEWKSSNAYAPQEYVFAISGSASNAAVKTAFRTQTSFAKASFASTMLLDEDLESSFYRMLVDDGLVRCVDPEGSPCAAGRGGKLMGVALLSESGTVYGSHFANGPDDSSTTKSKPFEPEITARFPLHIALVRHEFRAESAVGESTPFERLVVDPQLDDPVDRDDSPPALSKAATVADDLALVATLDQLASRHVRFIGVAASDPLDLLFVIQQIRLRVVDATVFLFSSEALLGHPSLLRDTAGTLMISPYSGFLPAQAWVSPFDDRTLLPFARAGSEGVYNATTALLAESHPSFAPQYLEYDDAFSSEGNGASVPSIWVSVVGNGSIWPIARYRPDDAFASLQIDGPLPPRSKAPKAPPPTTAAMLADIVDSIREDQVGTTAPSAVPKSSAAAAPNASITASAAAAPSSSISPPAAQSTWIYRPRPSAKSATTPPRAPQLHLDSAFSIMDIVGLAYCACSAIAMWLVSRHKDLQRLKPVPAVLMPFRGFAADDEATASRGVYVGVAAGILVAISFVLLLPILPLIVTYLLPSPRACRLLLAVGRHPLVTTLAATLWAVASTVLALRSYRRPHRESHLSLGLDVRRILWTALAALGTFAACLALATMPIARFLWGSPNAGIVTFERDPIVALGGLTLVLVTCACSFAAVARPSMRAAGPWRRAIPLVVPYAIVLATLVFALPLAFLPSQHDRASLAVWWVRLTAVTSRASPYATLVLLMFVLYFACVVHVERLRLHESALPLGEAEITKSLAYLPDRTSAPLIESERELAGTTGRYWAAPPLWYVVALPAALPLVYVVWSRPIEVLEASTARWALIALIGCAFVFIIGAYARFLDVWLALRSFLQSIARHPVMRGVERIGAQYARAAAGSFAAGPPTPALYDCTRSALADFIRASAARDREQVRRSPVMIDAVRIDRESEIDLRSLRELSRVPPPPFAALEPEMQRQFDAHMRSARREAASYLADIAENAETTVVVREGEEDRVRESAEDLVATHVAGRVLWTLPQLRNLLAFAIAGNIALAMAIAAFLFQPRRFLVTVSWVLTIVFALGAVVVFVQLEKDDVLSRLGGTEPGKITWDRQFIAQIVFWLVLPLVAFLAVQYPEVSNPLFAWLRPLVRTVR